MAIEYVTGDATAPLGGGARVLVHVCNDVGKWGKGFVLAISRRWKLPEQMFKAWHRRETEQPFALGEVQFVEVEHELWVANLIGQRGLATKTRGEPAVRYDAVRAGLAKVRAHALANDASVHMPRIGSSAPSAHPTRAVPSVASTWFARPRERDPASSQARAPRDRRAGHDGVSRRPKALRVPFAPRPHKKNRRVRESCRNIFRFSGRGAGSAADDDTVRALCESSAAL